MSYSIPESLVLKRAKRSSRPGPPLHAVTPVIHQSSPILRTPNEILHEIGRLVKALPPAWPHITWKQDLSSLSCASKAFTAICQRLIFESITIRPGDFQTMDKARERLYFDDAYPQVLFGDIFPGVTAQLASYVRTLTYRDYAGHPYGLSNDRRSIKALNLLINVSELRIEATEPPSKARPHLDVLFDYNGDLEQALLKIMHNECMRALRLVHVRVPAAELSKCLALKTLELSESLCRSDSDFYAFSSSFGLRPVSDEYVSGDRCTLVEGSVVQIEHLVYRGGYRKDDSALLPESFLSNRFLFRWDNLRSASLGFEDSNFKTKSEVPNLIMRDAERLERLDLHTTRPSNPFGPQDQQCPIGSLHPGSFETLTKLSLRVDYAIDHPRQWRTGTLRDPYHGLLKGGMLQRLENLEELCLEVRFGGHLVRAVYENEGFLGDGWTQLDRVLAPKGRESPFKRLRRVSLLFGTITGRTEEDYDEAAFKQAFVNVVTQFEGMKEVAWEGANDM